MRNSLPRAAQRRRGLRSNARRPRHDLIAEEALVEDPTLLIECIRGKRFGPTSRSSCCRRPGRESMALAALIPRLGNASVSSDRFARRRW